MKLKTLEDFELAFNTGLSPASSQAFKELKQEAIKWIKEDIKDYRNADLHLPAPPVGTNIHNFIVNQRQKWKERFNINEEDLK